MTSKWIVNGRPIRGDALALFCFPHAGSGSHGYRGWKEMLPAHVEVFPVELPGRGTRLSESSYHDLYPLVSATLEGLAPFLRPPFAFFGHSMGALLGFELARALRRRALPGPVKIYVSGNRAPHLQNGGPVLHTLPDTQFLQELGRLNGTPRSVLDNKELMDLMLPVLRADFAVCETYQYQEDPPLDAPIVAFGGENDAHVSRADILAWSMHTSRGCTAHMLPGDHFFFQSAQARLMEILREDLTVLVPVFRIRG